MSTRISRRDFTKTAAYASLGTLAGGYSSREPAAAPPQAGACRPAAPVNSARETWTNWPLSEREPDVKYTPTSLDDLVAIARNASAQARVKASGSRWSASAAARADNAWIDTSGIGRVLNWNLRQLADQASSNINVGSLVLVQAGMKIHALATQLWQREKSFPTLGGSMGQSLAGAISTGTHGSDIDRGPIAGMVRAIHLVAPGGCEYWLEHPERPIASADSLRRNYPDWHQSIAWRRDADVFNAALVSVGRCGLIYSYVLEVEPAYQLRSEKGRSSWSAVRAHLQRASDSGDWRTFIRSNALPFNESTTVQSRGAPTAIVVNGRLSVIWAGTQKPGQFRWIHAESDPGRWARKRIVDDGKLRRSIHRPAIAFFNDRYYVAWTGTDANHPYIHLMRSTDATGEYWTDHIRFDGTSSAHPEAESSEGPVLLAANDRLHIVWVGSNKPGAFRWITSRDGLTWGDKRVLTDSGETRESRHRPAIAFLHDRYYLAWTGTNPAHPYLHMIRSTDSSGRSWGGHIRFDGRVPFRPEAKSSDGPCLLAVNNRLHLVWVGTNKPGAFRWVVSIEGSVWVDKRVLADPGQTRRSNYTPDLAFHAGRYYLFWLGYASEQNVHVIRSTSSTGTRWTGHARLSAPPGPRIDMRQIRALEVALSPESANGQAWWTVRTPVPLSQLPTRVQPEQKPREQRVLVEALAKALNPRSGPAVGTVLGWLADFLLLGGAGGGFLSGVAGAIGGSVVANRDDVFGTLTDMVFAMSLNGPAVTGPSFEVTSGNALGFAGGYEQKYREFWSDAPKVMFTEVFFDAQRRDYLRFIDRTLAYFASAGSGKQGGYIAIRFMAQSEAPLAMQRWPITAAVEVVLLQALDPASRQNIEAVNRLAQDYNARFHWGMIRTAAFRPAAVQNEIERWKAGAAQLGVRAGDGFSSAFSRQSGLEP